jgi:transposase
VANSYRPVQRDQPFLMPPDMREWLPADHLVWFLLETLDALDTSAFHVGRRAGVGAAAYDPDMLLALLIYAYCQGVRSSRQIERRCFTDVAFRVLCAQDVPDHATIARFRADYEDVFAALFTQVLQIAAAAGLARFGTVAIDGTKIVMRRSTPTAARSGWRTGFVRSSRMRRSLTRPMTRLPRTAGRTRTEIGCRCGCGIAVIERKGSVKPRRK